MARKAPILGFAIACAAAMACNALTGVGDLVVDTSAGLGDAAPETSIIDSGPPVIVDAGGSDATTPIEAGPKPLCPSAGNSCVPQAPTGWDGPFLMYNGDRNATGIDCPIVMPRSDDENVGNPQGSIACTTCKCGSPKNQNCSFTMQEFLDNACTAPEAADVDPNQCQTADPEAGAGSITVTTSVNGGFCDKQIGTQQPSDITWPNVARLCNRDDDFLSDGCPDGSLCVPDGVQPFLPHTCIRQMHADVDCPADGPWTQKTTTFNNVADDRGCTTDGCNCVGPNGSTCSGFLHIFSASTVCGGANTMVRAPTASCITGAPGESAKIFGNQTSISGGSCTPTGNPTAVGGVAGGDDVNTICCVP